MTSRRATETTLATTLLDQGGSGGSNGPLGSDGSRAALATPRSGHGHPTVSTTTVVHGFAQTRECIGPLADSLTALGTVVLVDAPGHGDSTGHASADIPTGASLLARTMPTGVLVGYSMGGRLALRTALDHPDRVSALILIGATPGIADDGDREQRRRSDSALADRLVSDGVRAFLDEWLALPMFRGLPEWARFDTERERNSADGLAASLRRAGTGSMEPLWERLGELTMPVLCLTGSDDERYCEIAHRMADAIGPNSLTGQVPGAGHAAHLEAPDAAAEIIVDFLEAVRSAHEWVPGRSGPQAAR